MNQSAKKHAMHKLTRILLFLLTLFLSARPVDATGLRYLGSWQGGGGAAWSVRIQGNFAYIAKGNDGLQIVDISDPSNPQPVGHLILGDTWRVEVAGNIALLGVVNGGLQIVDISNPANPQRITTWGSQFAVSLQLNGQIATVGTAYGVSFLNLSNPAQPVLLGSFGTPSSLESAWVANNLCYTTFWQNGFRIYDVSNLSNAVFRAAYNPGTTWGVTRDVRVYNGIAYLADEKLGLEIVNVSNPASPQKLGRFTPTNGYSAGVAIVGTTALLATRSSGLHLIDVSNPTQPQLLAKLATDADDVQVVGNLIAIASPQYGLILAALEQQPGSPIILNQPADAVVQLGASLQLSVVVSGASPLNFQWRKDGQNIVGATNATLNLNSVNAGDSGGYSVVAWNGAGSAASTVAHIAVLSDGANGNQPQQISPAPTPSKPLGVDSLVVVTHGYEPFGILNDVSWVNAMADAIRSHSPANWLVIPYTWEGTAWATPGFALINARIQGGVYADALARQNWQHVHLIGHSAGSAFVEAAAKKFKEISPSTTVHCTFLDPYLSFFQVGTGVYGANADWADCYFAQDATGNFTKGPLANAYSVDVTWVDPNKQVSPIYCSSSTAGSTPPLLDQVCGQRATSSHGYPHDFYFASINGTAPGCASGYGFGMSKEGGGWNSRGNYPVGNQPLVLCGPTPPSQNLPPLALNPSLQINALPYGTSAAGVTIGGTVFTLTTHSPTWLAVGVAVSNAVNCVQFDAGFISTNAAAEGLLTVYWNTNQIGVVDERVSSTNLQSYRFALPAALTNGLYTLSFRLDPMSNMTSSVTVTNVKTGFSGVQQPILSMSLAASNNTPRLLLSGAPNYNYLVESSTNLTDWTATALLVNTNGAVLFADPAVTNFSRRFYRATMP